MSLLLLLELGAHPGYIAATKIGSCTNDGAFFLDFSRRLRVERWLGFWNSYIGHAASLQVPVIHNGEVKGTRVIEVTLADPYFGELRRLWKERYPRAGTAPSAVATEAKVAADFALHFPPDAGSGGIS